MAIVSQGQVGVNVKYAFDRPIALLSTGIGFFGGGPMAVEGDRTISGNEGHGAIQFEGTVASLSWTVIGVESWHGFTVGIPDQ